MEALANSTSVYPGAQQSRLAEAQRNYVRGTAAQQEAYASQAQAKLAEPTVMQGLLGEVRTLTSLATILRNRVEEQRGRLLRDLPPQPAGPQDSPSVGRSLDPIHVSFHDVAEELKRLSEVLSEIDSHTTALRKIG